MKSSFLNLIELETVRSTNDTALELLKEKELTEGTVIWAHEQTAGKGQGVNHWESEPGRNLTFTLVLHPRFMKPEEQFLLNKCIALGVYDFVKTRIGQGKAFVKWPNDIYAGELKIGGILINNTISGSTFETTVAGIGLNVNQQVFNPSLPNPVSLKLITGKESDLWSSLQELTGYLEKRYQSLRDGKSAAINADYLAALLGFNDWRSFRINGGMVDGKITGVTEFGRLVLETRDSRILQLDHHEVEFAVNC